LSDPPQQLGDSAFLSVVIPALDEERWLPDTLADLRAAAEYVGGADLIVVDNDSRDRTAEVASAAGARVVREPVRGVGRARNAGARAARGEVLVFVDADTRVPAELLERIATAMAEPRCVGGAVDVAHRPRSAVLRAYLAGWRLLGRALRMWQGAVQFCRRQTFDELHGYDERQWMGEDVDFVWRMRRLARRRGDRVAMIRDIRVVPSPRRYDQWPLWRTLFFTNPVFVTLFARWRRAWGGWYESPPR